MNLNPGSHEALNAGCECPVLDNNHGIGRCIGGQIMFWRNEECPLHGESLLIDNHTNKGSF